MPDRNPKRLSNWRLTCKLCLASWPIGEKVEVVHKHFVEAHKKEEPILHLAWLGKGPQPTSIPKLLS